MAFVFKAIRRRPFEQKSLVIARAISSTLMILTFIAFFVYLIYQLLTDQLTLISSFEEVSESGYLAPDIELCYSGNWTLAHCSFQWMNWSMTENSGCEGHYRDGNYNGGIMCKVFQANNTNFGIAGNGLFEPDIRRVDIYWRIDNITENNYLSVPSLPVTLFDQSFSTWRLNDDQIKSMIPMQKVLFNKTILGAYKSMTMLNYSSAIYYTPHIYRVIDPRSSSSLIGLYNNYVETTIVETFQHDWPLRPNINLTRGDYHGFFSIQPAAGTTIEVLTAKRQYTVLSTLALLGGAWGGMTTLYAVIFGTSRLTPFGLVHHIPLLLSKKEPDHDQLQISTGSSASTKTFSLFKRSNKFSSKTALNDINSNSIYDDNDDEYGGDEENKIIKNMTTKQIECDNYQPLHLNRKFKKIDHRFNEMELILKEFVVNMDYYNDSKTKHLRNKLFQSDETLLPRNDKNLDQIDENINDIVNENATILMKHYK